MAMRGPPLWLQPKPAIEIDMGAVGHGSSVIRWQSV
jgi:hypothetical protein